MIDELRKEIQHGFSDLRTEIKADHEATARQFDEIRAQIKAQGDTTRRHFDIMAERVADSVKVVAEATAHQSTLIDNHERRLKRLERPRK